MSTIVEKIVKIKNSPDGARRICIIHRSDGLFGFWEEEQAFDYLGNSCWTPTRVISGLFETEELAEHAAQSEINWFNYNA